MVSIMQNTNGVIAKINYASVQNKTEKNDAHFSNQIFFHAVFITQISYCSGFVT